MSLCDFVSVAVGKRKGGPPATREDDTCEERNDLRSRRFDDVQVSGMTRTRLGLLPKEKENQPANYSDCTKRNQKDDRFTGIVVNVLFGVHSAVIKYLQAQNKPDDRHACGESCCQSMSEHLEERKPKYYRYDQYATEKAIGAIA